VLISALYQQNICFSGANKGLEDASAVSGRRRILWAPFTVMIAMIGRPSRVSGWRLAPSRVCCCAT
jgi:hypothetical protein